MVIKRLLVAIPLYHLFYIHGSLTFYVHLPRNYHWCIKALLPRSEIYLILEMRYERNNTRIPPWKWTWIDWSVCTLREMPCCQMSWNALLPNSLKCHVAKQFKMSCCQPCWNTPLPNMSKCHVEIPCWLRYWNTHYFFEKVSFSVQHWLMNKSANNRANKKARNAILQWSEDRSVLRWCEYCRR